MRVIVAEHPLITHKLTMLRDKTTPSSVFRKLADELVTLLAYEATRDVRVVPHRIETPVAPTESTTTPNISGCVCSIPCACGGM